MVNDLLELVLDKKELKGISRQFAQKILDGWLAVHPKVTAALKDNPEQFHKKKECNLMKKEVRQQLRELYGVFFEEKYAAKKKKFVEQLIEKPTEENANAVLSLHRSTNERLSYYKFLYHQLLQITGTPTSILDLGCGFNPFSYQFLGCNPRYHCVDIACEDLELIGKYLTRIKAEHTTKCDDIILIPSFPKADVAFCFKLFDTLETLKRDVTAEIIKKIDAEFIIVSFSTATISQKNPIGPREWFERLVTGKVIGHVTLPNEQFVIITKQKSGVVTEHQQ